MQACLYICIHSFELSLFSYNIYKEIKIDNPRTCNLLVIFMKIYTNIIQRVIAQNKESMQS